GFFPPLCGFIKALISKILRIFLDEGLRPKEKGQSLLLKAGFLPSTLWIYQGSHLENPSDFSR
ncbi:MAG: hypothetical protein J6J42_07720, partial [Lachnospiraceae bacterium]|nr:hypothetical protein [Lachnospiraceae bacterium]